MTESADDRLLSICTKLDSLMRHDPVGRGTERLCAARGGSGAEILRDAALSLATEGSVVAIVTGFYILAANPPAAETDGPPGSLFLAQRLVELGAEVCLISDAFGAPLLESGLAALGLTSVAVQVMPIGDPHATSQADDWVTSFFESNFGRRLTHLVSIERAGPSHTAQSLRLLDHESLAWQSFDEEVPDCDRDRCHNMAGVDIEPFTAPAHRLFDLAALRRPDVRTIGVGDGGNEIGFGAVPWSALRRAIKGLYPARTACRVATEQLLIAGISDWGGYALAAATCHAAGRANLLSDELADRQRQLLETIVAETAAVDGITAQHVATVDSLDMDRYLGVLREIIAAART